jgi:four helix bundle protein
MSIDLAVNVLQITEVFPTHERFGLTAELRRAAVSVASNVAGGHGHSTRGEYLRHISIARGSTIEVEVQLRMAEGLGYTNAETLAVARERCDSICRLLARLVPELRPRRRDRDL